MPTIHIFPEHLHLVAAQETGTLTEDITAETGNRKPRELMPDSSTLLDYVAKDAVVVDKTDMIFDLLTGPGRSYCLSRPRKFGKTLLLDTIHHIVQGRRHLFKGTHIERKGSEYSWDPYPVIRISFSGFPLEPDAFKQRLLHTLDQISEQKELFLKPAQDVTGIMDIVTQVSKRYPSSGMERQSSAVEDVHPNTVLLIDDFDLPLLLNVKNPKIIIKIRMILQEFFKTIEICENMLRFTFITGVSKFSFMHNIDDITFDKHYSSICGFTEDEIRENFHYHILCSLPSMAKQFYDEPDYTYEMLMDKLESWYGGYSWDGNTKVFNPYSVTCCLNENEFAFFWYNYYKYQLPTYWDTLLPFPFIRGKFNNICIDEFEPVNEYYYFLGISFLFYTGYLTIDRIIVDPKIIIYILKCTNCEIKEGYDLNYMKKLLLPD
ncbi:MAG: AAA family ATPase [Deltaproteobacteria bacterium]|jgi:hypothetical protein|nr:AAA family ATPase [Deltaproteobacteria bacterium]